MKKSMRLINPKFRRVIFSGRRWKGIKEEHTETLMLVFTTPFLKQGGGHVGSKFIVIL